MKLQKNLISLGRGRLSSATVINSTAQFIIKSDGKLIKKSMKEGTRQTFGSRLDGFCDDAWVLPFGRLERLGNELFYAENE